MDGLTRSGRPPKGMATGRPGAGLDVELSAPGVTRRFRLIDAIKDVKDKWRVQFSPAAQTRR